jgi:hypothetical protein
MNARATPPLREVPGCIAKREADAVFAWSSVRRLEIVKGNKPTSLSADDLRSLLRFVQANQIEEQLS